MDPEHVNALWISGIGLASLGEYEASNAALERLLPLLGADSESRSQVLAVIDENLSNLPAEMQSGSSPEPEPSMFVQAEVSVSIDTPRVIYKTSLVITWPVSNIKLLSFVIIFTRTVNGTRQC